jgi:DNA-binding transcriptional regulator LsrR (DeoR family)
VIPGGDVARQRLLHKIARMYYVDELTQRDIAARLNISMATVSRGLSRAKSEGIVEIRIRDEGEGYAELETAIETAYGLRECVVVPGSPRREQIFVDMARALAELLGRTVSSGDYLGVSWGETLKAVADHLPDTGKSGVDVVPIIGAMGEVETGIYPNAIAGRIARKLGGSSYLVNTPAILDTAETSRSIRTDGNFVRVLRAWEKVTTLLVGVSGLSEEDSVSKYEIIPPDELARLREAGAVAAMNFTFINPAGILVRTELDERMIKMDAERMQTAENAIVVAAGARKARALSAALASGIATVLVTDAEAAAELAGGRDAGAEN